MRTVNRLAVTAAAAFFMTSCVAAAPSFPIKLIPGRFTPDRQPDGNTVIFEDKDGLIVVDTGRHLEHQAKILDFAKARGKPIKVIVNTHWHLDHSGGNQELRAVYPNAKLYTSEAIVGALDHFLANAVKNGEARLADPRVSDADKAETKLGVDAIRDRRDLIPDVPIKGPMTLPYGRQGLRLNLARHAATEGDTWIYDPSTRTVVAGDLVVIPLPFFDTACAEGWRRALADIAKLSFTSLIPGHGPTLTRAEFDLYRSAYGKFVDCAESKVAKQVCIDGWQKDAAPFLDSEQDHKDVQEYLDYYIDNVLRSPEKKAEFCGATTGAKH